MIVVGAGPVGLALAGELRLGGARVTVLEARTAPNTESRASTLHARTMEAFDQRGLLDAFGAAPNDPRGHFGGVALDLGGVDSPYPGQWKVPQPEVERVLAGAAVEVGAVLRRGCRVQAVREYGSGVSVAYDDADGTAELRAAYAVGCDGERSTVREAVEIELTGRPPTRAMLRADVVGIDIPDRRFERHSAGLAIASRRPDGVTRVMVHEFGAEPRLDHPVEFADIVGAWQRVVGEDIGGGTPLWVNAFGDASRRAARYRQGRVLLAGDAAHQQMPVGGQALNLGLQDAFNLGWKLAAIITGTAPNGLLDTYQNERQVIGRRVLSNIEAQATLLLGAAEVEPLRNVMGELMAVQAVRSRLAATVAGLDIRYGEQDRTGLVGLRMPYLEYENEAGWTSTTEQLRAGCAVLFDLSGKPPRGRHLADIVADYNGRVLVASSTLHVSARRPGSPAAVVAPGDLELPPTLLVRPDGYVAWVGDTESDPRPAIEQWVARPSARLRALATATRSGRYHSLGGRISAASRGTSLDGRAAEESQS